MHRKALWVALMGLILSTFSAPALAEPRERKNADVVGYVIADSVLLGARQQLRDLGLRVDAVEGRQPARLKGALKDLPNDGLPVVIHLGTNGRFSPESCRDLVETTDGNRDVVLVTVRAPRAWVRSSNSAIRACVSRVRESKVALVPWHRIANSAEGLVYPDGIHLTQRGSAVLVAEVSKSLGLCVDDSRPTSVGWVARVGQACGDDVSRWTLRMM